MTAFFIILSVLMALVIYFDATRFIIPNWLVGLVLVFYPAMVLLSPVPVDWLTALGVMCITFAVGYFIFFMRWMGGGDIKLLTACSLWCGLQALADFAVITAVLGGLLALSLLAIRKILPGIAPGYIASGKCMRLFVHGEPAPYGLAIAAAFLIVLWQQLLPGLVLR